MRCLPGSSLGRCLLLAILCLLPPLAFAASDDFNGDGKSDVLWRNQATGSNTIWQSASATSLRSTFGVTDLAWNIVGTGDFNGDGRADVLWRNSNTGANTVWASADAATQIPVTRLSNLDWKVAGIGDFNGDGKSDVFWRNSRTGLNVVWLSGNSATVQVTATLADLRWKLVGVGDFDGNGRADVLWRHGASGANLVWKAASAATPMALANISDAHWEIAGIGDFDHDNRSDILWRNGQTGTNAIWRSANAATPMAIAGVTNLAWRIAAVGDYGGDGSDDILWRHAGNGSNVVWNSANPAALTRPMAVSDLAWTITYRPPSGAIAVESLGYLESGQLDLASLDAGLAAETGLSAELASGPSMLFQIGAGNRLYFLAPQEQFQDGASILVLRNANGSARWRLLFRWSSRVGNAIARIQEAGESGQPPVTDTVALLSSGIGSSGNVNSGTAPAYTLRNAPVADASVSEIILTTDTHGAEDVTSDFTFDPQLNRFTMQPLALSNFRSTVSNSKKASLTFSISTAGRAQTYGFEQSLRYANGSLVLSVFNSDGSAATTLAGARFLLRGVTTGTTALGTLGSDARVTFVNVPADTFEARQVLLGPGTPLSGFIAVPTSDSTVSLAITRPSVAMSASASYIASRSRVLAGAGFTAPARTRRTTGVAALRAIATLPGQLYTASVSSGPQGELIAVPVDYTTPSGTLRVKVQVDVATDEYPQYTQQNSQYDDAWQFDLQFPPPNVAMVQSGNVNQSHSNAGSISFKQCIALTAAQQANGFRVTGKLAAMNVADSVLPTTVTVTIANQCDALTVTDFSGTTRTSDQLYALTPKKSAGATRPNGNLDGQYLSMPRKALLPTTFGTPSLLRYAPSNFIVQQVELLQRTTGSPDISLGTNYLAQGDANSPGTIRFAGLRINPVSVPLVGYGHRIQIMAIVRGQLPGGGLAASDPIPLVIDARYSQFTPLYLMSELPGYVQANRYGAHSEPGGDNWATLGMSDWVMNEGLRYDDLSAANVKQAGPDKYRSVIGHSGHSDGQQADLRYWDASGGHTDTLGGANNGQGIATLASAALAEVTSDAAAKPNLAILQAWIGANRTNIAGYAQRSEVRSIFIGNRHIAQLLIDGKFPGTNTAVPGIAAWGTGKSPKVTCQPDHLNHWHVNTIN